MMIGGGVVAGIAISVVGGRVIRGLLYEISATDLRLFAGSVAAVVLVALAAVYTPARRAGLTDPATVLRGWR